jgi:excisionase family DNA binding protein
MPRAPVEPLWYSVAEVMRLMGLSEATVRRGMAAGEIPFREVGRRKLIPARWVRDEQEREEPERKGPKDGR